MRELTLGAVADLRPGDIVRNAGGSEAYTVTAVYGDRATAVRTVDITHAHEWILVVPEVPRTTPPRPGEGIERFR